MTELRMALAALAVAGLTFALPPAHAVSPKDIAVAQKLVREAAKLAEKYREYDLVAPEPLPDNSGKYLSPYHADGTMTEWAEKSLHAEAGAQAGEAAGGAAADAVAKKIPFGGLLKNKAKDSAGAAGAAAAVGGWDYIRDSSDVSFDDMQNFSVYLQVTHGDAPGYDQALAATMNLYPELKKGYRKSLNNAYKAAKKAAK